MATKQCTVCEEMFETQFSSMTVCVVCTMKTRPRKPLPDLPTATLVRILNTRTTPPLTGNLLPSDPSFDEWDAEARRIDEL